MFAILSRFEIADLFLGGYVAGLATARQHVSATEPPAT